MTAPDRTHRSRQNGSSESWRAEHPAAAVEVGDDRERARRPRAGTGGRRGRRRDRAARRRRSRRRRAPADARRSSRSMNARASADRHRLDRRQAQLGHHLQHDRHVGLQPADDAVVALRATRSRSAGSRAGRARRPRRTSARYLSTPPMYGRNTRGLPGTLAPMYQELAVGNSVMSAQSLTCCTQPASAVCGRLDACRSRCRAARRCGRRSSRRAARSTRPCSTAPTGCPAR